MTGYEFFNYTRQFIFDNGFDQVIEYPQFDGSLCIVEILVGGCDNKVQVRIIFFLVIQLILTGNTGKWISMRANINLFSGKAFNAWEASSATKISHTGHFCLMRWRKLF